MNTKRVVLIVLAVIGGLVSLWVLGMWLMHSMMTGSSGMMGSMACPAFCFLPVLLLGLRYAGNGDYPVTPQSIEMRFS